MEAYQITVNLILMELSNSSSKSLLQKIISYLQLSDIKTICNQAEKSNSDQTFLQLIRIHHFISNYLNRVDRTFYYTFYQSQEYINIEEAQIRLLTQSISGPFLDYTSQYKKCFKFIKDLFPQQVSPSQIVDQIELMITDIQIPMPKLKRENQGIFCKTPFQNFLVHLKFKNQCFSQYQQIFESLNIYFSGKEQAYLQKLFMKALKDKVLNKKVRFLRFTPFQITFENFENYLVERNSLHNFLISLFAITDVWLNSIKCYLGSIQDPFHRYIELITRYSIYRNFVISVQQNFSFVFEQYNDLYEEVFGGSKPKFRFWRSALTKWLLKFEQYHSELSSIYFIYLTKLRTEVALEFLQEKQQQSPQIYMSIKNRMTLREYQSELETLLLPARICNGIESFFDKDKDLIQLILVQYMEYMIDLSINEETVHWCGHSEQILSEPYLSFEKYVLAENKMYLNYIRNLSTDESIKKEFLLNFYQNELTFFQSIQMKPVTLKKVFQSFNDQFKELTNSENAELSLTYNFRQNDEILKYFNQKANVKYELTSQEAYFYSIKPLLSSQQLLTKSTNSTEITQEQVEDEEDDQICEDEYFSQNSQTEEYQSSPQNQRNIGAQSQSGKSFIQSFGSIKGLMQKCQMQKEKEKTLSADKQKYLLVCRIQEDSRKQQMFTLQNQYVQASLQKNCYNQDSTKENDDLLEEQRQIKLIEIKNQIDEDKNDKNKEDGNFSADFSSKIEFYSIDI